MLTWFMPVGSSRMRDTVRPAFSQDAEPKLSNAAVLLGGNDRPHIPPSSQLDVTYCR